MNRGRKESIEIYDKDKQIPGIEKYMTAYTDTNDKNKPEECDDENNQVNESSNLSPEKGE